MNAPPNRRRAIAVFTILAFALAGCSNKTNPVPAAQTPPAPANEANASIATPAAAPALMLPRGTRLQVRLNQTINVKHAESGERFSGTLTESIMQGDAVAVPAGSPASGEILVAHRRGLFKGRSLLALTLTRLDVKGTPYRIDTGSLARTKKGKGRRSAAFIGGGATGGVGLLVGGLAGGGAGALGAAFTGNRDLSIPAESVVTFRLQEGLTLAPDTQLSAAHAPD
jgi:hypothetical protein